jgi:hypothetical protein
LCVKLVAEDVKELIIENTSIRNKIFVLEKNEAMDSADVARTVTQVRTVD